MEGQLRRGEEGERGWRGVYEGSYESFLQHTILTNCPLTAAQCRKYSSAVPDTTAVTSNKAWWNFLRKSSSSSMDGSTCSGKSVICSCRRITHREDEYYCD